MKRLLILSLVILFVNLNAQQNVSYIPFYTDASFNNKAVGVTLGTASVSNGSSSYSIPIISPPKPENGVPDIKLTLSYNSMRGDGCGGYGWDISGLSAIQRGNKTIAYNGKTGPSCTSEDEYLWDGKKLVLLNPTNNNNWM